MRLGGADALEQRRAMVRDLPAAEKLALLFQVAVQIAACRRHIPPQPRRERPQPLDLLLRSVGAHAG